MSFPQAPESGDPPPPHGPAGPEVGEQRAGTGLWAQGPAGPGPWDPGPPGRGYQNPSGSGLAVASLVCGVLILPSASVTAYFAILAMLFTRPDTGSNGMEWVANVVFYSLPALLAMLSLTFGILAVRQSIQGASVWRTGVAGLIVAAAATALIVLPLFIGEFDVFS